MTKRNIATHRKAMGFASEMWDVDNNEPLKSGTTEADCIEHVRCSMYCFMRDKKMRKKEAGVTDDEEEEEVADEEDDILSEMQEITDKNNDDDDTSIGLVQELGGNDDIEEGKEYVPNAPQLQRKEAEELQQNNDEDYVDKEEIGSDDDEDGSEADSINNTIVPQSYFFPGYMAFIAWGPFCDKRTRLRTVLVNGLGKKDVKSRAQMRKENKKEKEIERNEDTDNARGLTTDQMINLESVKIQRQMFDGKKQEMAMAGMSMQNQMLNDMIARAERRAERLCPERDPEQQHHIWKKREML